MQRFKAIDRAQSPQKNNTFKYGTLAIATRFHKNQSLTSKLHVLVTVFFT